MLVKYRFWLKFYYYEDMLRKIGEESLEEIIQHKVTDKPMLKKKQVALFEVNPHWCNFTARPKPPNFCLLMMQIQIPSERRISKVCAPYLLKHVCFISYRLGRKVRLRKSGSFSELISQPITTVLLEQPLALPGSAIYFIEYYWIVSNLFLKRQIKVFYFLYHGVHCMLRGECC